MSSFIKITGFFNHTDEWKRLHFTITDPGSIEILKKFEFKENEKTPIMVNSDTGIMWLRINLDKYSKPYIKTRYEPLIKQNLLLVLKPNRYNSVSYGKGMSMELQRFTKL
jgi:hypothetical protein